MTEDTTGRGSDTMPVRARGAVTEAERARVAELHAAGWSRAAIARELERSPTTVGRIAAELDLSFDGSKTAAATARKQIDNRSRRAALVERAYDQAAAVLDRMAAKDGYDAAGTSTKGETVITRVALPPAQDVKALAGAFSTLTGSATRMESIDGGNDVDHAKSMLGQLAVNLDLVVSTMDTQEQADG